MNELERFPPGPLDLTAVRELARLEFDEAYDALMLMLLHEPPATESMTIEVELTPTLLRFAQGLLP